MFANLEETLTRDRSRLFTITASCTIKSPIAIINHASVQLMTLTSLMHSLIVNNLKQIRDWCRKMTDLDFIIIFLFVFNVLMFG